MFSLRETHRVITWALLVWTWRVTTASFSLFLRGRTIGTLASSRLLIFFFRVEGANIRPVYLPLPSSIGWEDFYFYVSNRKKKTEVWLANSRCAKRRRLANARVKIKGRGGIAMADLETSPNWSALGNLNLVDLVPSRAEILFACPRAHDYVECRTSWPPFFFAIFLSLSLVFIFFLFVFSLFVTDRTLIKASARF